MGTQPRHLLMRRVEKLRLRAFESGFCEQFFDKDDQDAMGFVAAAANIRASIFGIPMNSLFALKCTASHPQTLLTAQPWRGT